MCHGQLNANFHDIHNIAVKQVSIMRGVDPGTPAEKQAIAHATEIFCKLSGEVVSKLADLKTKKLSFLEVRLPVTSVHKSGRWCPF